MNRNIVICLISFGLVGCAQAPGKGVGAVIGPLPAAGIVAADPVQFSAITVSDTVPGDRTIVGELQGTSCRNSAFDPAPTEAAALTQLKQKAATAGATGVAGVTYKTGGLSLTKNCWAVIVANGQAYR
ncbi:hypothetical protein NKJ09_22695 [Mesorhizobium sp. M0189]|uniref:hypothetical protein n=1 Tax=Mesorhizobium sp. M0189 TaxID=2956909 RepID=UPI0033381F33